MYSDLIVITITLAFGNNYLDARDQLERLKDNYNLSNFEIPNTNIGERLNWLDRLRFLITDLDEFQNSWWLPWGRLLGLQTSDHYLKLYLREMQALLNNLDEGVPAAANSDIDDEERASLNLGIAQRINLISTRLDHNHQNIETATELPAHYLRGIDPEIDLNSAKLFDPLFKRYVQLSPSSTELSDEQNRLIASLETVINASRGDFTWLIRFTESQRFANVRLDDFWPGSRWLVDQPTVSSAYTLTGMKFINNFLDELSLAAPDSSVVAKTVASFKQYYEGNYLQAWLVFAEGFDYGKNKLRGREEWLKTVELMSTPKNPYFVLMQRMQLEVEPFQSEDDLAFRRLFDFFARVQQASNDSLQANDQEAKSSKATDAYLSYTEALTNLSFSIDSTRSSFGEIVHASLNPDNIASGQGAGAKSWGAIIDMQRILGKPDDSTQLFWNLYSGPVRMAYQYMQEEASCFLQDNWEKKVIAGLEDETPDNRAAALISDGGLTWQYMDAFAAPFLVRWPQRGYQSSSVLGIDWTPQFIDFLNQAARGRSLIDAEFKVVVNTLPTGINQNARIYPYLTHLNLTCADGVQTLSNYNYYTSKKFRWSLNRCSDVILGIQIGQFKLEKHYSGQKGFPKFLADFRDGRRFFSTPEFPRQQAQLRNEKVHAIDVNYGFRGQETIIDMLNTVPLQPPLRVTECRH